MRVLGVIPARYKSSRFPGKPLVPLLGKPMIIWVAEGASKALGAQNVVVATDDDRIAKVVEQYGYNYIFTSKDHQTGTDRLVEVAHLIDADLYVNIQGDEPTINYLDIAKLVAKKFENPGYVINGFTKISSRENPESINIPKVVMNGSGDLLYMSRALIPGFKDRKDKPECYHKQVCIYVYDKNDLLRFGNVLVKGPLEKSEDIEILRFLDLNIPVKMIELNATHFAVDVPLDVEIVEKRLKEMQ